jgi:hypothetical protein
MDIYVFANQKGGVGKTRSRLASQPPWRVAGLVSC